MQDRYAGDIGDYGKFSLLSELAKQGLSIGINWYKTEPLATERNNDGGYIDIPQSLRKCNPALADKLSVISKREDRSIQALEKSQLLMIGLTGTTRPLHFSKRIELIWCSWIPTTDFLFRQ